MESEEERRQLRLLLGRVGFTDDLESSQPRKYLYASESIQPFLQFYKLLALRPCGRRHRGLRLNLPDTVVFNDRDNPAMWFFTDQRGEVARLDSMPFYTIQAKFTEDALDTEIVALLKKPDYYYGTLIGNEVRVVSGGEVRGALSQALANRGEVAVLQRFVRGGRRPSLVRTCWRRDGRHECWVLASKHDYASQEQVSEICKLVVHTKKGGWSAVRAGSRQFVRETLPFVENIRRFVEGWLPVRFNELVADFIRDEAGTWWFVSTRAFLTEEQARVDLRPILQHAHDGPDAPSPPTYARCRTCRYCARVQPGHRMARRLTLLMLLQCDRLLAQLGDFPWLQRGDALHLAPGTLYAEHPVCDSCYRLYREVERLARLQARMAQLCGVSGEERSRVSGAALPCLLGQSPRFGSRLQRLQYDPRVPRDWGLPPGLPVRVQSLAQEGVLRSCRFMVFLHRLRDIPTPALEAHAFSLGFEFLGRRARYPLDPSRCQLSPENGLYQLELNKLRVLYFFAADREHIRSFLKDRALRIRLLRDGEVFGSVDLELEEFRSEKVVRREFFKMFSGREVLPFLSWGLFVSLGLEEGEPLSAQGLVLTKHHTLLLPEAHYSSPVPLPPEWIAMIQEKHALAGSTQPTCLV